MTTQVLSKSELARQFTLCEYRGGGASRMILSPTKILAEFGLQNYGFYRAGDRFMVHNRDVEARPDLFVDVEKLPELSPADIVMDTPVVEVDTTPDKPAPAEKSKPQPQAQGKASKATSKKG